MHDTSAPDVVLTPELLVRAYTSGFFPMADAKTREILWYSPDPRTIFELDAVRISRSLRQTLRHQRFSVTWNTAFDAVIRACSNREETWISPEIIHAYVALHLRGIAQSVECWYNDELAGGLYGVALGGAFFGESMFSEQRDASKVAFVELVGRLRDRGFVLLDAQYMTPHLQSLGAIEIPRAEYMQRLRTAVTLPCSLVDPPISSKG